MPVNPDEAQGGGAGAAPGIPPRERHNMDKVTRYEWQGSGVTLVLLCLLGITIPLGGVYFMTRLLRIETEVADGEKLSEFLRTRK